MNDKIKIGQPMYLYFGGGYRCGLVVTAIDQSSGKDGKPCFRACNGKLYYQEAPHIDVRNEAFYCETKLAVRA
jgi:hypothetical protein